MSRLRILHLGKYYPPERGGIETVVESLCRGEASWADSQALVLSRSRTTTAEIVSDVSVRRVGSIATVGAVSIAPTLPWWLARSEVDLLVLHEPNPAALVAYAMARPRVPLVVWMHSEVIRAQWQYELLYRPWLAHTLGRARRVVVASPPMRDVSSLTAYREKCVVIPYGAPRDCCQTSPAVMAMSQRLRASRSRPTVLFVGRLVPYKGVDVLVRALLGLAADLVIVGDGPLRASLVELARQLGISQRVRFLGAVPRDTVLAEYHACDVFVLPSVTRQETFGMVQLEAMACGRPVVSTDLGTGVAWVNQHGQTGFVVTPGDVDGLRQALATLIADSELRRRLGEQARARVWAHFTLEKMCSAMRSLYLDLVPAASAPTGEPARVA